MRTVWRFVENVRDIVTNFQISPLLPEYKIPAITINAEDKMAVPWREPMLVRCEDYC